jgi:amidohydrolase
MLEQKIKSLAAELKGELIANRRHLHSHPELSFAEYNTADFVASALQSYGLKVQRGVAGTGVVALLEGQNPQSKVLALRADMDALPILEANDVPYRSQNPGVMHACGHDAHTASLLGTAKILSQCRTDWNGTLKFIFQPGEEKLPGGASLMIGEGVLENPKPKAIVGQHVMPLISVGKVGFRSGMYMASADEIYLKVKGKGGHAAMPEFCIDPVLASAQILVALQAVVSRRLSPKIPAILSFGKLQAQGATNIIPNEVLIEGTFRCMDETWRNKAHEFIKQIAQSTAQAFGAECEVEIKKGYPFLQNEAGLTTRLQELAKQYLGEENVLELDLWMASEDFAFYTQQMPGCFYRLGTANPSKGIVSGVHTPTFDIDEDALEIGSGLMAWLAVNELGQTAR